MSKKHIEAIKAIPGVTDVRIDEGTHLLIDVPNLSYRNWYAMRYTMIGGEQGTITYGLFRDLIFLSKTLDCCNFVFAFDQGKSERSKHFPEYKANRKAKVSDSPKAMRQALKSLGDTLRQTGYSNVFSANGWEADDIIAKIVLQYPEREFIIVSNDTDFYQLLSSRVSIWNPFLKKTLTHEWFEKKFGFASSLWVRYKAILGCKTDNIPGIKGIGETNAAHHIRGKAKQSIRERIIDQLCVMERNKCLITIPYPKLRNVLIPLVEDSVDSESWNQTMKKLKIHYLLEKCPHGQSDSTMFAEAS